MNFIKALKDRLPDGYVLCLVTSSVTSDDGTNESEVSLFLHHSKDDCGCLFQESKDTLFDGPTHNVNPDRSPDFLGHQFIAWVSFGPDYLDALCRKNGVTKHRPFKDTQSWCNSVLKLLIKEGDLRKKDVEAAIPPTPPRAIRT